MLVCAVVLAGSLYFLLHPIWVSIVGLVCSALVIGVVWCRVGDRWLTDLVWGWWRYRRRRGRVGDDAAGDGVAELRELVPDLVVENITGGKGEQIGMGSDGAGWFAVFEVLAGDVPGLEPAVPLAELTRVVGSEDQPGGVVQVVTQASTSGRWMWVGVRLDADLVAESTLGNNSNDRGVDIPRALAELVRRIERVLRRVGLTVRLLDADGVTAALKLSCELLGARDRSRTAYETWRGWHSATLVHSCYWLRSWPEPDRFPELLSTALTIPTATVSVAITVEPHTISNTAGNSGADGGVGEVRCLLRVGSPNGRHDQACFALQQCAELSGARIQRLDGEHAPAVYATAPTGGGAR